MSPVQIIPPLLLLTGLIWGVNHRLREVERVALKRPRRELA